MASWVTVYRDNLMHRSEIVKAVLIDAGIPAVIVNKRDPMYQIGSLEVQVANDDVIRSLKIIEDDIHFE